MQNENDTKQLILIGIMKIAFYIVMIIGLCVLLVYVIDKCLKGRFKKYTREEIEEKMFGN